MFENQSILRTKQWFRFTGDGITIIPGDRVIITNEVIEFIEDNLYGSFHTGYQKLSGWVLSNSAVLTKYKIASDGRFIIYPHNRKWSYGLPGHIILQARWAYQRSAT